MVVGAYLLVYLYHSCIFFHKISAIILFEEIDFVYFCIENIEQTPVI